MLEAFRTIVSSARGHDAEVRKAAGIAVSQLWALSEIDQGGGLSVNDLAERMFLHQTTASNLVNALTEKRFIQRRKDALDQRITRLHTTAAGKLALKRAPGPYPGLLVDALRHLKASHLARLRKELTALLIVMQGKVDRAAGETLLGE